MNHSRKLITAAVAVVVLVLLVLALRPSPVPVTGVAAHRGYFVEYVEEEGRTRLRDTWTVSAPIGGYMQRVELEPGDAVTAGQVVFAMEPVPAPALDARAREQAREALAAARARLRSTEAEYETRQAEAEFAASEFRRFERLFERGLVSATEMDRARSQYERSQSAERAAREAVEVTRFEMESARAVLEIADGQRSPSDQPVLAVRSPIDGVVLRRHRCCEAVVNAGEPVLEVGDLADLEIQVDILSVDALRVRDAVRVDIERWGGEAPLQGRVRRVEPAGFTRVSALGVDEQRVPVRVEISSPRQDWQHLGEGFRVETRFILWEGEDVLQVPTSALFRANERWHVFVVDNGRASLRTVEPGRRSGLQTQISEGLEDGEIVITHPGAHIDDGTRVAVDLK
jgi:HlyD family secretion protein